MTRGVCFMLSDFVPVKHKKTFQKKAYVVTVDMGYGHQRAVDPLRDMAVSPIGWSGDPVITANVYPGIPKHDQRAWEGSRRLYEMVSRIKRIPLLGTAAFGIMDYLQRIEPFYPKRDLSEPILQLSQIYRMIQKGWGRDIIFKLNKKPLPLVTSFFAVAFFAEEHGYKGDIYCLCTDTDVSRAWAPLEPKKTRIKYFAPNKRVARRLELYGVPSKNIFVTGFPLPKDLVGGKEMTSLRERLGCRLGNLDPNQKYQKKYGATIESYLGQEFCHIRSGHPLTIAFAVGGAGAQREIGVQILESLHSHIDKGTVRLNLIAGSRPDVYRYYNDMVFRLHLEHCHGGSVNIIYDPDKRSYFSAFNKALETTDILWTKPSELSFYAGLGLPIIMAPAVGSQEEYNRAWLHSIGAGFEQENPRYTHEWLFDWLESGWLAEAAMEGFLDAPKHGAYHIEDIVLRGKKSEIEDMHLL